VALNYDTPNKRKRAAGMSAQTLSRHNFSRAILLWTWLVVAVSLALGSSVPPASSYPSSNCDTLATPTAALELVATPTQKSTSGQSLIDGFIAISATGISIADFRSLLPCPLWNDAPSLLSTSAWQSPSLPRPPPNA